MKRLLIIYAMIFLGSVAGAQDVRVKKIRQIPLEQEAFYPTFGNKSHLIIVTDQLQQLVTSYDIRRGREVSLTSGHASLLQSDSSAQGIPLAKVAGRKIELTKPGYKPVYLTPAGDHLYIWVSLSPKGDRLLFTAAGKGTFISDLQGHIVADLGYLNAPSWLNDFWVIGMDDQDDGDRIESSDIFTVHIPTGKRINLTEGSDEIALYPKASGKADRVVFHNPRGQVFTMKIKIRE